MNTSLRRLLYATVVLALLGTALGSLATTRHRQKREDDRDGDLRHRRAEWFYKQRAYPHERIPPGMRVQALRQRMEMETAAQGHGGPGTAQWTPIGPQPTDTPYTDPVVSGRVDAFVIDPRNSNTVYLGAAEGGVWKTTDGGNTWTPLTDNQASLAIGSLALDPSAPDTIYAGTGDENFAGQTYYGEGILKSTDGGNTWTHIPGPFAGPTGSTSFFGGGARIGSLCVHPTNGQILLAATEFSPESKSGIYRSADGGQTWKRVLSGASGTGVVFDPTNGNIAYAALGLIAGSSLNGVYKSADAGLTWTKDSGSGANKLPSTTAGRLALAIAPSSTTTLYAGIENAATNSLLGIYKTTDGGTNWSQLTGAIDYCTPQCDYDNVLAVQPTNASVVYAGGAYTTTLTRTLDGGATWTVINSAQNFGFLHADMHALTFSNDGSLMYLGNDGGAYITTNPTATTPSFTALNNSLALTQFYPGFSIHPTNVNITYAGTQDNGTQISNGTLTWNDVECGDGSWSPVDPSNPNNVYTDCVTFDIERSTSGGGAGTWQQANSGINQSDRVQFIPPLVVDPSLPQTLYFGTQFLYQTIDGASNWTAISPDLTGGDSFFGNLSAMAVAPSDSNTVYTSSGDDRIFVSTNASLGASATFTNISSTTQLPPRYPTSLAVDPAVPTTAYITYSGFSGFGDHLGHVFQTTNGGTTWSDISGNLPNIPGNYIVVEPDLPATLYLATDVGVFYTANGGATWNPVGTGLPSVAILGLALHRPTHTLRAGSFGRSMWDFDLSTILPIPAIASLLPASASAGSAAFTLMINGSSFISGSTVQWNGSNRTTTFVNSGQLTAAVLASDVATAGTPQVTVANPAGQGGVSAPATFTVNNPAPSLASILPTSATAGGGAFTLAVSGSNFVATSTVQWNGGNLGTTFVNGGSLSASVPASDIATAGTASVTVFNPGPGGGTSTAQTFTINNPVASVTSIAPSTKTAGGASFTLTVNGASFVGNSAVQWNGSPRATTFVSGTQLRAAITATDIAVAGIFPVTVFNPGPGGGTSAAVNFTVNNPKPSIASLSPANATAGGPAFTLTVNGRNYVSTSVVRWNGSNRTTTFVSATKLTAAILASDIAIGGSARVTVFNPAPGGGSSRNSNFIINDPVPVATSLSPSSAKAGGPAFTLTVTGSKFVPTSQVRWNGTLRATTFVSATQLQAAITARDIQRGGAAQVTVFNPPPAGGTSGALNFTINP